LQSRELNLDQDCLVIKSNLNHARQDTVADGVVALTLRAVSVDPLPHWEPGAHVDLILDGAPTRQYSLCGDPADDSSLRLGILRDPEGRGSSLHVHDRLQTGDIVQVRGPRMAAGSYGDPGMKLDVYQKDLAIIADFAREVGAGLPTAMTVASPDAHHAQALARELSGANFRAYSSTDIMGVEIGGAVKNALAVGAGLSDGLGFGANTRVALITRGLKEMTRLGVALGASADTFMGLAGLGDLVLTCTDDQSRNRRFGLLLGAGRTPQQALAEIGQVVEGYAGAGALHAVAAGAGVEMPLCAMVYRVLYEGLPAKDAVQALMSRPIKAEIE